MGGQVDLLNTNNTLRITLGSDLKFGQTKWKDF